MKNKDSHITISYDNNYVIFIHVINCGFLFFITFFSGLFTADQKLKSNNGLGTSSAIYTRQNPPKIKKVHILDKLQLKS
jgi:hypothetical protein